MLILALYKKPSNRLYDKLLHYLICIFTLSRYSHCEIVIDGLSYSSSNRDGGVRIKHIPDIGKSGHWDLFYIDADKDIAIEIFNKYKGWGYDYLGIFKFIFSFLPNQKNKIYCSKLNALMLGSSGEKSPYDLFEENILKKWTINK